MFGTIGVGVDESGHADNAVREVAKIAAAAGDAVVVFHGVVLHPNRAQPYTTETRDESQHLVDRYVKRLTDTGVNASGLVHREVQTGVGGALIDLGLERSAGLLAVGTRGRSDLASLVLGSVAHECTSLRCRCSSSRRRRCSGQAGPGDPRPGPAPYLSWSCATAART